jgi:P27 family predicted phage terminase small subunit
VLNDNRSARFAAAPAHLAEPERQLWDKLIRSYTLDDPAAQELLLQACEARGRAREAREQLTKEGLTYRDDRNNLKAHPAIQTERSAQSAFLAAMRSLRLDIGGVQK